MTLLSWKRTCSGSEVLSGLMSAFAYKRPVLQVAVLGSLNMTNT
jgi:hypothetical protein